MGIPPSIKNISVNQKSSINTNVNENISSKDKRELSPLKDLLIQYELKIPRKAKRNEKNNMKLTPVNREKRDYLASEMAEKLGDRKSLGCCNS